MKNTNFESESRLTFLEATSIIVGHGVGSGILAVPYLASRNSWLHIILVIATCYFINLLLHLMIAELSYNNKGAQFITCLQNELFKGKVGNLFTWITFALLGISVLVNIAGFITGSAAVLNSWFEIRTTSGMLLFYLLASVVVFVGMKLVGFFEKISVLAMVIVVAALFFLIVPNSNKSMQNTFIAYPNLLALYSTISFSLSAVMSVPQVVKGLNGNVRQIKLSIALGSLIITALILALTFMTLLAVGNEISENGALVDLAKTIGGWISTVGFVFSLLALSTSFWANTLNLRDIVHEKTKLPRRISYAVCSLPALCLALFGLQSFVGFTRLSGIVQVLTGIGVIVAHHISRKKAITSPICGFFGKLPFELIVILSSILATVGAVIAVK